MIRLLKKAIAWIQRKKEPEIKDLAQKLVKAVTAAGGLEKPPTLISIWNHPEYEALLEVEVCGKQGQCTFKGGAIK